MKKRFLPFTFFLSLLSISVALLGAGVGDGVAVKSSKNVNNEYLKVIRANQNIGLIDNSDVLRAKKQAEALRQNANREDLNWVTIGPDNFGGRTRAIIYDNQDASGKTVYAGAVTGGIWKSIDNGMTWTKINESTDNLYVTSLCQSSDGTIYAGTGEMFGAADFSMFDELGYSTGFMGSGLYKSTDGDNFELLESTKPQVGNTSSDWAFINEVQVDKNGNLFAATNNGLMYSNDGGATWSVAKDTSGNELVGVALDVKVGEGIILVTVDNNCYYSDGDANAFKSLSTGEDDKLPLPDDLLRVEFAISPDNNSIAYASIVKTNGNLYGIYRTDNSGENWSLILPGTPTFYIFYYSGLYANFITVFPGNPDKVLLGAANLWVGTKTNDNGLFYWEQKSTYLTFPYSTNYLPFGHHVYTFRPGNPNEFLVGTGSGVFHGTVSGDEFEFSDANNKYYTTQFYTVGISGMENYVMGGTQENSVLIMDQQSNSEGYARAVFGITQGIFFLENNGGYAAVSLINPDIVVVGGPTGKIYRSEDRGENYSVNFLDGITLNENFFSPFALWENFDNENSRDSVWFYARGNTYEGGTTITVQSKNSLYPFKYKLPDDITLNPGDSILVNDPVSSRLFVGSTHHVYMTKGLHQFAKATEWFEIANTSTGYTGTANALGYSADANHLYVGTTEGKLFRISNLALAYNKELADVNEPTSIVAVTELSLTDPETGDPITQAVTSVSVDPQDPNKVLVTVGNYGNSTYVFYTENALDQNPVFVSKQGNLPKMPVYSSVIEMKDGNKVFIGTDMGVYMTDNIGASDVNWVEAFGDMGRVPVMQLKQQTVAQPPVTSNVGGDETEYPGATNYGIIYAATYGRGIFRCNDYRQPVGIGEIYSDNGINGNFKVDIYPNPVVDVLNVNIESKKTEEFEVSIFDLNGKMINSNHLKVINGNQQFTFDVSDLVQGTYLLLVKNSSGIKTKKVVKY